MFFWALASALFTFLETLTYSLWLVSSKTTDLEAVICYTDLAFHLLKPVACAVVIETLLAFILPPVAVFLVRGCGCSLVINILLTLLGWLPGVSTCVGYCVWGIRYGEKPC